MGKCGMPSAPQSHWSYKLSYRVSNSIANETGSSGLGNFKREHVGGEPYVLLQLSGKRVEIEARYYDRRRIIVYVSGWN